MQLGMSGRENIMKRPNSEGTPGNGLSCLLVASSHDCPAGTHHHSHLCALRIFHVSCLFLLSCFLFFPFNLFPFLLHSSSVLCLSSLCGFDFFQLCLLSCTFFHPFSSLCTLSPHFFSSSSSSSTSSSSSSQTQTIHQVAQNG